MKEWYLIGSNTKPNMLGGYENQAFNDYKDDAFAETLETDIADTVTLYNYDLSISKEIRCIIEGNTADTQLKSMERCILTPIGTLHSGDYIFFEDEYWIVDGRPGNNKIYEKATLKECQYLLRWQNANGKIIERWANLTSASKYDVGENGNKTMILTSNNFTIIIPNDSESYYIDGQRVFIDLHPTNPTRVFKITRNDDALFNHNSHGGTLSLIADKKELNTETDNQELKICNYIAPTSPSEPDNPDVDKSPILFTPKITFKGSQELKVGGNYKSVTGYFEDSNGIQLSDVGKWDVITIDELLPYIQYTISDNILKIKVTDDEFAIGGKIRIQFSDMENSISTYVDFDIVSGF